MLISYLEDTPLIQYTRFLKVVCLARVVPILFALGMPVTIFTELNCHLGMVAHQGCLHLVPRSVSGCSLFYLSLDCLFACGIDLERELTPGGRAHRCPVFKRKLRFLNLLSFLEGRVIHWLQPAQLWLSSYFCKGPLSLV